MIREVKFFFIYNFAVQIKCDSYTYMRLVGF